MGLTVLRPGLLTTIQDLGRFGYQQYGVIVSGVMDSFSHRIANLLVGNREQEASMEITMLGPVLQFEEDTVFAICGADLRPTIEGVSVPLWRTTYVKKGTKLSFKGGAQGCRAYLAVAGGFKVKEALSSKSTYLKAGIGGFEGRALESGDQLTYGLPTEIAIKMKYQLSRSIEDKTITSFDWGITPSILTSFNSEALVRVLPGKEAGFFTEESRETFLNTAYTVTNQSDRMGYRLEGSQLSLTKPLEMISEAVTFGTVQVPPEGKPIVLMADRQTTGGYPKLAQVISVDLPILAQARPGNVINFKEVSLAEAQTLYVQREKDIKQIALGISLRVERS